MKILQVNKYYFPDVGGVETVCQQYSEYLAKDHEVTVLCVHKHFKLISDIECINNVKVIRCSSLGSFLSMPISLTFPFYYIFLYFRSNIIFLHLPFPLADLSWFFVSFFKKKVFLVWHSDIVKQGLAKKILSPILNFSLKKAYRILVTSPNMLLYSKSLMHVKDKCVVLPLSIDTQKIHSLVSEITSCSSIPELSSYDDIDGLFFGRLCYYKGIDILIDSLISLKNEGITPRIVIAGSGEYDEYVKNTLNEKKLDNVIFINRFLTEKEKYTLVKCSRCFIFPSVEISEAFGITQLEAMALGVPVINTNLKSGVPWVSLDGETGLTVEPKNSEELKHALCNILNDELLRRTYSKAAVIRVDKYFDDSVVFDKLDEIIYE
ncbi:glycosyltransferase [Edwardsiella tarda]|uniref:glycosyltransferase n=1 Tax=Edwardsiella tarda TaxID=636 RepID=UPI000D51D841|nr:glycosyltransferase [Edwardsiella tarda]UCQ16843.1 glycosyltransferase [Edwardsiella tarda]